MNRILLSEAPIIQFIPRLSSRISISHVPSVNRIYPNFLCKNASHTVRTSCIAAPSDAIRYGGWDDFELVGDSVLSGESTPFQNFLNSLGMNDKRYIFVYVLGFVCALAVTRIRVSSVIAIPACVLFSFVGFIIGYINGGHLSLNGIKKRPKDDILTGSIEKLRSLVDILNGVDAKIANLNDVIKRYIGNDNITLADLEGVVRSAESTDLAALGAKSIVEGLIESILTENQEVEDNIIQKSSNKSRKEGAENGFDFNRFVARLSKVKFVSLSLSKMKDSGKRDFKGAEGTLGKQSNIVSPAVEEQITNPIREGRAANRPSYTRDKSLYLNKDGRRMTQSAKSENVNMADVDGVSERVFSRKEHQYKNRSFEFINNQQVSLKLNYPNRSEMWDFRDGNVSSLDFSGVSLKRTKTEASFKQEQKVQDSRGDYLYFDSVQEGKTEIQKSVFQEEGSVQEDNPSQGNHDSAHDNSYGHSPSVFSDDKEFSEYLAKANLLLKEAKQDLKQHDKDGNAENALRKSARLLSKAIELRPMSLLAVGQLGNTYLLHGELKLRISRDLRAILSGSEPMPVDKWGLHEMDDNLERKDKLIPTLVDICEECEELLVKAGRNYRLALSIDGNDMRALYNWGLALSFRGQLIADIGPGAARDADKVFLAAIDKFDAMLSKSNIYAPEALFRWGTALQQRSRLRPRNNKEKLKFLQQARRLYEDALDMDSDNFQVQEALSTCISELNFWYD